MRVEVINATENPEETVCRAARNDYSSEYGGDKPFAEVMRGIDGETVEDKKRNLIQETLLKHGHFGPLEHVQITFHVEGVSRSLMAQLTRHRHATYDVQSMRYVSFDEMNLAAGQGVIAIPELGNAEVQGRNAELPEDMSDDEIIKGRERVYQRAVENAGKAYEQLLNLGVAPENARMVLPIGTKVNIVFSVNLRMLLHIADLRAAGDAQWEIREMTEAVLDLASDWAPITMDYYQEELKGRKNRLAP